MSIIDKILSFFKYTDRKLAERTIRISFVILNAAFLVRLVWLAIIYRSNLNALLLLTGSIVISSLLIFLSFGNLFSVLIGYLSRIRGSIFAIFGAFVVLKKGLKLMLSTTPDQVYTEIGSWFMSLFLWLAGVLLITFIIDLNSRIKNKESQGKKNEPMKGVLLIGFLIITSIITIYFIYTQVITPLKPYANYDPEYGYLLNSLTPLKDLELYTTTLHPGTFLQLLGTIIVILLSPLSMVTGELPYTYAINNPGIFLFTARLLLLFLTIGVLYFLAKRSSYTSNKSDALAMIAAMLAYFVLHDMGLEFLTIWSPNSFNFIVGTSLMFLFYQLLIKDDLEDQTLWMFFLAAGLGATFHIYMITITAGSLIAFFTRNILEGKRFLSTLASSLRNLVGTAIGFLIGTLIILPNYGLFFEWVKDVLIHQDYYGHGSVGLPSLSGLTTNFLGLMQDHIPLFIFLLFALTVSFWIIIKNRNDLKKSHRLIALLIGLYFQVVISIIVISKAPKDRYLLSIASITPIILLVTYQLFVTYKIKSNIFLSFVLVGFSLVFGVNIVTNLQKHTTLNHYLTIYEVEYDQLLMDYAFEKGIQIDDINRYWSYGTYSSCYAQRFGNDFAKKRFTEELLEICPRDFQFDIYNKTFGNPDKVGVENLLIDDENNILIATRRTVEEYQDLESIRILNSELNDLIFIIQSDDKQQ